jgi:predicted ATP-grasp superfamily ATP-dependent carboligase
MGRVIVTHSRGWHALAMVRSLGRQGVEVFCGEEAPFAPCFFSKYCAGSFQHPSVTSDPDGFIEFMVEKVRELKPEDPEEPYVLMPVHKETWLFSQHRERFEDLVTVPLTSFENMKRTHDKGKLALLAEELGITIPPTRQFHDQADLYRAIPEMEFPVFLKVREGAAGVGLKKCDSAEELTASFKQFVDGFDLQPEEFPLVQAFVPGEDYCVSALFDRGRRVAMMTYHNVRAFPRGTGAGALRETVALPEAEASAQRLLEHLGWHGMAQLDYRVGDDGTAYLIELNPRFFGGLPQAIASGADYPWLLFRMACGEMIEREPELDYDVRTEAPMLGLLATLDEIAHDERAMGRLQRVSEELGSLGRSNVEDVRLKPLWEAIRDASNPSDIKAYLGEMFEKHRDTINDVLQSDDPRPAMGVLFPIALMLKHGKLSVGVLTAEAEIDEERPRRSFRSQLLRPRWKTVVVTILLFVVCVLLVNAGMTGDNLGRWLLWPSESVFGSREALHEAAGTVKGAMNLVGFYVMNVGFLYVFSAVVLRQRSAG